MAVAARVAAQDLERGIGSDAAPRRHDALGLLDDHPAVQRSLQLLDTTLTLPVGALMTQADGIAVIEERMRATIAADHSFEHREISKDEARKLFADQPFKIDFKNQDQGTPHNVEIKDSTGASKFRGEIITGPAEATYDVPALTAGSYTFVCSVHPNMTGTLTAG